MIFSVVHLVSQASVDHVHVRVTVASIEVGNMVHSIWGQRPIAIKASEASEAALAIWKAIGAGLFCVKSSRFVQAKRKPKL